MLRKVLIGIGIAAASGGTVVACVALRASGAGEYSVMALACFAGMAAWVAGEVAKGIAADAKAALLSTGFSLKEACALMDMDMALASRQLSAERRLDYEAWSAIPRWEQAFADMRSKRLRGWVVQDEGVIALALTKLAGLIDREVMA